MYDAEDFLRLKEALAKHEVAYMFIGKGAAIIQGYSDTTQDIDIYPRNSPENNRSLVKALRESGFEVDKTVESEVLAGRDFIQFREPFDLDIVFAPDGFESYDDAEAFKKEVDGCPVMSLEGILKTKRAAGRIKDRESLTRLQAFKDYLDGKD